jgi:hypothetical protein
MGYAGGMAYMTTTRNETRVDTTACVGTLCNGSELDVLACAGGGRASDNTLALGCCGIPYSMGVQCSQ